MLDYIKEHPMIAVGGVGAVALILLVGGGSKAAPASGTQVVAYNGGMSDAAVAANGQVAAARIAAAAAAASDANDLAELRLNIEGGIKVAEVQGIVATNIATLQRDVSLAGFNAETTRAQMQADAARYTASAALEATKMGYAVQEAIELGKSADARAIAERSMLAEERLAMIGADTQKSIAATQASFLLDSARVAGETSIALNAVTAKAYTDAASIAAGTQIAGINATVDMAALNASVQMSGINAGRDVALSNNAATVNMANIAARSQIDLASIAGTVQIAGINAGRDVSISNNNAAVAMNAVDNATRTAAINAASELERFGIATAGTVALAQIEAGASNAQAAYAADAARTSAVIGSLGSLKKSNRDDVLKSLLTGEYGYAGKTGSSAAEVIHSVGDAAGSIAKLLPF